MIGIILTILNSLLFLWIGYKLGKGEKIKVGNLIKKLPKSKAKAEILEWIPPQDREKQKQQKWLKKILKK